METAVPSYLSLEHKQALASNVIPVNMSKSDERARDLLPVLGLIWFVWGLFVLYWMLWASRLCTGRGVSHTWGEVQLLPLHVSHVLFDTDNFPNTTGILVPAQPQLEHPEPQQLCAKHNRVSNIANCAGTLADTAIVYFTSSQVLLVVLIKNVLHFQMCLSLISVLISGGFPGLLFEVKV